MQTHTHTHYHTHTITHTDTLKYTRSVYVIVSWRDVPYSSHQDYSRYLPTTDSQLIQSFYSPSLFFNFISLKQLHFSNSLPPYFSLFSTFLFFHSFLCLSPHLISFLLLFPSTFTHTNLFLTLSTAVSPLLLLSATSSSPSSCPSSHLLLLLLLSLLLLLFPTPTSTPSPTPFPSPTPSYYFSYFFSPIPKGTKQQAGIFPMNSGKLNSYLQLRFT